MASAPGSALGVWSGPAGQSAFIYESTAMLWTKVGIFSNYLRHSSNVMCLILRCLYSCVCLVKIYKSDHDRLIKALSNLNHNSKLLMDISFFMFSLSRCLIFANDCLR